MYEIVYNFLYDISKACIELLKVYEIFAEGSMRWQNATCGLNVAWGIRNMLCEVIHGYT